MGHPALAPTDTSITVSSHWCSQPKCPWKPEGGGRDGGGWGGPSPAPLFQSVFSAWLDLAKKAEVCLVFLGYSRVFKIGHSYRKGKGSVLADTVSANYSLGPGTLQGSCIGLGFGTAPV